MIGAGLACHQCRGHRPIHQAVEIGPHQLRLRAFRHVAGKGHRLLLFVHGQDGAHHGPVVVGAEGQCQREMQGRGRQTGGQFAEIAFVEFQGRLAVEFEQHVAPGTGDAALRAEDVPATAGTVTHPHPIAVDADGGHPPGGRPPIVQYPGPFESVTVTGQPAGDDHVFRQHGIQAIHQFGPVHRQAVGQHQHTAQALPGQGRGELLAGCTGGAGVVDFDAGMAQAAVGEPGHRDGQAVIGDFGAEDLAGGGAAGDDRGGVGLHQFRDRSRIGDQGGRAEYQYQGLPGVECREFGDAPAAVTLPEKSA